MRSIAKPEQNRKITEAVLGGMKCRTAGRPYGISYQRVSYTVHQYCEKANKELYYELSECSLWSGQIQINRQPHINVLRKHKEGFLK